MKRDRKKQIGLLGPWGSGNLGDATIQEAVIFNLKKWIPDSVIYGFSPDPSDTERRHRIKSFNTSNFWVEIKINYPDKIKNGKIFRIAILAVNFCIRIVELISNTFVQSLLFIKSSYITNF